ncbi:amylosucrase [Algoriphagus namhaensis]|uniref:Amylosucrase n=1 Tax=Algoriphagus namhaensis TaxID=915353 RepID=A0ABV8AQL2_9BACT
MNTTKAQKNPKSGKKAKPIDSLFEARLATALPTIQRLFEEIYGQNPASAHHLEMLVERLKKASDKRSVSLKKRDKEKSEDWFLSNEHCGMSLYVDRFCGNLSQMPSKLDYLEELEINLLHLMPIFESPEGESDGGYAVSDYRKVDAKFGTIEDLEHLVEKMQQKGMHLMLDIVLNHTSHHHEWAKKAKAGDPEFQDFYYMYENRWLPNQFDASMPEIFPESSPGNFTFVEECQKWVMTVFHNYQWDLNFRNPRVLIEMVDHILFYANLGVDILRIDAPAFIWKETGTSSQNLPQVHTLLQLIKACVKVSTPGMALLGEAIVSPKEIIKYFGTGEAKAKECDFAYNATQMALQWDMLATGDTQVMLAAQHDILQKPQGTSWISYTRCHDDIGLGFEDASIRNVGKDAWEHRNYLKDYFSGKYPNSPARGALFSSNPKTGDARISGTLASLCGLEKGIYESNEAEINLSVQKILLMQAHSFFIGGLPMVFYGDEVGYTNDYSFENDPTKSYDNRWMHRPLIDWKKNDRRNDAGSLENQIFTGTQRLLAIRKSLDMVADRGLLEWFSPHNIHVAAFSRTNEAGKFIGVFNFGGSEAFLTWYAFREKGFGDAVLHDHWSRKEFSVGQDHEHLILAPYGFHLFQVRG